MEFSVSFLSPLGYLDIKGSDLGIRSILKHKPTDSPNLENADNPIAQEAIRQLTEYFQEKRTEFDLPLDWSKRPEFHKSIWKLLLEIPYGETTSYKTLAYKIGDTKSIRAVGQANAKNPIMIVVPCHRVIGSDGDLTGYAGGLDWKRELLHLENPFTFALQTELLL
jgi:methylated-DNA-[protein]-cysteine S-methyltransferase